MSASKAKARAESPAEALFYNRADVHVRDTQGNRQEGKLRTFLK